ncbi:hypothetical protein EXIGLDRAFT_773149 [Exidia glandulosa HHB12029]|uniref:Mid2 domain-containing protein n=1 Tax=Exidia glandulosa HHB12029 TaxID=1314781 RepID=A0A165EXQ6_EXIGL|nr:hypothetical protein EXIGLDRAFT_773149 [Exidia glandulosa HHB12029]
MPLFLFPTFFALQVTFAHANWVNVTSDSDQWIYDKNGPAYILPANGTFGSRDCGGDLLGAGDGAVVQFHFKGAALRLFGDSDASSTQVFMDGRRGTLSTNDDCGQLSSWSGLDITQTHNLTIQTFKDGVSYMNIHHVLIATSVDDDVDASSDASNPSSRSPPATNTSPDPSPTTASSLKAGSPSAGSTTSSELPGGSASPTTPLAAIGTVSTRVSSSTANASRSSQNHINGGIIAGVVVGVMAVIGIVTLVVLRLRFKRAQRTVSLMGEPRPYGNPPATHPVVAISPPPPRDWLKRKIEPSHTPSPIQSSANFSTQTTQSTSDFDRTALENENALLRAALERLHGEREDAETLPSYDIRSVTG